nr:hypothetical protein Iba_chr10fCG8780 [Ipomoea batatas]
MPISNRLGEDLKHSSLYVSSDDDKNSKPPIPLLFLISRSVLKISSLVRAKCWSPSPSLCSRWEFGIPVKWNSFTGILTFLKEISKFKEILKLQ